MADLWGCDEPDMTVLDDDAAWEVESDEDDRPKRKKAQLSRPKKRISVALEDDDDLDGGQLSDDEEPIFFAQIKAPAAPKALGTAKDDAAASNGSAMRRSRRGGGKASNDASGDASGSTKSSRHAKTSNANSADVVCLDVEQEDSDEDPGPSPRIAIPPISRDPSVALSHLDPSAAAVLRANQDMLESLKRAATLEASPSPEPPEMTAAIKQKQRESRLGNSGVDADALLAKLAGSSSGGAKAAGASGAAAASASAAEDDGPKVTLVFKSTKGQVKIRTGTSDPLGRVFDKYKQHADGQGWAAPGKEPKFIFDGERLKGQQTAQSCDMDDDDMIEVHW